MADEQEREARQVQEAILNSLQPEARPASRRPASTSTPTASGSNRTLDMPTRKRSKRDGGKERPKLNDDDRLALDRSRLRKDALELATAMQHNRRDAVLSRALRAYAANTSNSPAPRDPNPPKVEPWNEGFKLYRTGALRMTRTPGRRHQRQPNCIGLDDVLKPNSILGMFSNTFLLEFDFVAPLLPILDHPHASRPVPIFLGQPLPPDPFMHLACSQAGVDAPTRKRPHLSAAEGKLVAPMLSEIYQEVVGRNLSAVHPKCPGCSHSKIFVIRYPGFLLVVITSANTMVIDMESCDNHWYIQAFPRLSTRELTEKAKGKGKGPADATEFEQILRSHLDALECPDEFLALLSEYDYSLASDVHLVVSHPGVVRSDAFDTRSIGRLAALARRYIPDEDRDRVEFEVCVGSVGKMAAGWIESLDHLLRGKSLDELEGLLRERQRSGDEDQVQEKQRRKSKTQQQSAAVGASARSSDSNDSSGGDDWKIVFAPKDYVAALSPEVKQAASNLSSVWNTSNWSDAPLAIKRRFYQYKSNDPGRLFHEKSILWLRKRSRRGLVDEKPPLLAYFGSHNLSSAAWGTPSVSQDPRRKGLKVEGVVNFEIGVVVAGNKIVHLLEPGSTWHDIVTYERPIKRFGDADVPWVSPVWAKKVEDEGRLRAGADQVDFDFA
ncbi:hypothetical protein JCM11491_006981 [Sporobolomyces phaffii]